RSKTQRATAWLRRSGEWWRCGRGGLRPWFVRRGRRKQAVDEFVAGLRLHSQLQQLFRVMANSFIPIAGQGDGRIWLLIRGLVAQHGINRSQQAVADRNHGLLLAEISDPSLELSLETCIAGARRAP